MNVKLCDWAPACGEISDQCWSARREASCPADGHKAILLSSRRTRFTSGGKAIARMSCHGHLPKS